MIKGVACGVVVALLVAVYVATLPPSLTWAHHGADGGDLVSAVWRGSIPHPPGFPTYLLLGALFVRLPWGEPAWRLNLMSAVLAAGAAGLTAAAGWHLLRQRSSYVPAKARRRGVASDGVGVLGGRMDALPSSGEGTSTRPAIRSWDCTPVLVAAGLGLGLAPLFWSQALIAEVYATAAFSVALMFFVAVRRGPAWVQGLVWGMGMGAHPLLLFLAPVIIWSVWGGRKGRLWRLAQFVLLGLLGWGAMYGAVLLLRGRTPSPWGDVTTLAGWWDLVSGRLYHGYLFALPLAAWPRRLLGWAGLLARQFTPIGAVFSAGGWVGLWRENRPLAFAGLLAFGACSLYAIGYHTIDSVVYLVPFLPLAALWLGLGLETVAVWLRGRLRYGAWLILLLPLLQAVVFWREIDLHGEREAMRWANGVLQEAPAQAVLLTEQDAHTFTLWYAHGVLGQRPDVVVIDRDLWGVRSYRLMVMAALGAEDAGRDLSPADVAAAKGRVVFAVSAYSGSGR